MKHIEYVCGLRAMMACRLVLRARARIANNDIFYSTVKPLNTEHPRGSRFPTLFRPDSEVSAVQRVQFVDYS